MNFLYAAYIITWTVIGGYCVILALGFKRVQKDIEDLERR
jgi:CcmD family protein